MQLRLGIQLDLWVFFSLDSKLISNNNRNKQIKQIKQKFIKENERKRRNGEGLEYHSWEEYKRSEIDDDDDDYNDNNDGMPSIPLSHKQTSPEENQRSAKRLGMESSELSPVEPHITPPTTLNSVIHSRSLPQAQEEADLFFARANNSDRDALAALNNSIAEVNRLQRAGHEVSHSLKYVMSVFDQMESTLLWRKLDTQQQQKRNPKSKRKGRGQLPLGLGGVQRPHPPGFMHLVPKDQSSTEQMWRNNDTNAFIAAYILRNEDTFDSFYQPHPYLQYVNDSVSLTDIQSLRVYLNLHPMVSLGLSTLHLARIHFQVVLVELLASPGEYAFLGERYSLTGPLTWSPRPFDGVIHNLDTLGVAQFLTSVGFSVRRADDAQPFWCQWLTQMATEFPLDGIDYQGVLSRTFQPSRQLPHPLPGAQLWYPAHPSDRDNWAPLVVAHVDMPFDMLPPGFQAVQVQYPPLPMTSSDTDVNIGTVVEGSSSSSTQPQGEIPVDDVDSTSQMIGAPATSTPIVPSEVEPMANPTSTSTMQVDAPTTTESPLLSLDSDMGDTLLPFAGDDTLGGRGTGSQVTMLTAFLEILIESRVLILEGEGVTGPPSYCIFVYICCPSYKRARCTLL